MAGQAIGDYGPELGYQVELEQDQTTEGGKDCRQIANFK
jgi:hypothetical protein